MTEPLDIVHLQSWIDRTEEAVDTVDGRLVRSLRATLDQDPGEATEGEDAPLCVHWCLAPPVVANNRTGPDGHPARGGFLPPVPLPRRMWAGGEIRFLEPLRVGDTIRRRSRIASVSLKEGRTGRLVFVSVDHSFTGPRGAAVEERQDIVYRDMPPPNAPAGSGVAVPVPPEAVAPPVASTPFDASELALFRYSALTFNGHRIHYDRRYCIEEENYPGLVVHGPLQATLLARLAAETLGAAPSRFLYRGVSPLFDGEGLAVEARRTDRGLSLRAADRAGRTTMEATAEP